MRSKRPNPLPRATLAELVARLFAAGKPPPDAADRAWVVSLLTLAELDLWSRLDAHDQRHTIGVARRVERRLASTPHAGDMLWPAVALMHDVGKRAAALTLLERAAATLAARAVSVERARRWMGSRVAIRRRFGLYLLHGEVGARMIRQAGGREPIAAWAEVHQGYAGLEPPGFPEAVVEALIAADVA
jgi:hypothetical protein